LSRILKRAFSLPTAKFSIFAHTLNERSMNKTQRITSDPAILIGKPVIAGTRISAELKLKKMAEGTGVNDIIQMYPNLEMEDINAVLEYAAGVISNDFPVESAARYLLRRTLIKPLLQY